MSSLERLVQQGAALPFGNAGRREQTQVLRLGFDAVYRGAQLLQKLVEGAHPYLVSFLKLLCEEDLLGELPGCLRAYQDRYNVDHNILEVTAVSAVALTAPSREKLLAKLQKMTGKNIVLTETVDPAVLGGLRLDMDGTRLDGTVQRHLERLRTEIDGAVL